MFYIYIFCLSFTLWDNGLDLVCYHCAFSKHIDIVQDLRIKIFTDLWQWHLTPFLHVLNDKTPQMHIRLYPHLATRLCACHQPEWRHLSHKHPGPNNIPRCVLTDCRDTDIFTNSSQIVTTTITPVLKTASQSCFNEYHPIALTPIIMMCFEMLCYAMLSMNILNPSSLPPWSAISL